MFIIIWKLWLAKCLGNLNTQRLTTKISSLIWPAWLCANYDLSIFAMTSIFFLHCQRPNWLFLKIML
ncbi:Uncharacterised protein [Vibrio cholerae]|nr:Uncharacterised protein [Vibrio cholerae]